MQNYKTNIITNEGYNLAKPLDISWRLRYGNSEEAKLHAAFVADSYESLINMPLKQSRKILKQLKQAIALDKERVI